MSSRAVRGSSILKALQDIGKFPLETRRSVRRNSKDKKEGFVLGYVVDYASGWCSSRNTRRYPELASMLCAYIRSRKPNFKFTSIMVNKGTSALHVDSINCGPSYIVSFGDHRGGELWQYKNERVGKVWHILNKLTLTDGLLPHMTLPYRGERYSIVYYNNKGERGGPSPEDYKFLKNLGFNSPKQRRNCDKKPRSDLLPTAATQLEKLLSVKGVSIQKARSFIGDWSNRSISKHGSRR